MPEKPAPSPARDWRDEDAYAELEQLDRRGFAWEYLRRNPDYRREWRSDGNAAQIVGGVSVLRAVAPAIPPIWGLRFRGVAGHQSAFRANLLG